jgi:GAF domain-containing protein
MSDDRLRTAVAAGVLSAEGDYRALLQSIVEVARAIFGARASSIFLLDEEADELVFEAVAGEGSDKLIGTRLPSGTGIAGWVLVTGQPLVLEDVANDPRFARTTAQQTGYVPKAMMCVPLLHEQRVLGVLNVLDRSEPARFSLAEMDVLGLFGNQAAIALDLLQRARRANEALTGESEEHRPLAQLAEALDGLPGERQQAARELVKTLTQLIQ